MSLAFAESGFDSFEALQKSNDALMEPTGRGEQSLASIDSEEIIAFLSSAAATGEVIVDPRERRAAEGIIRFWAAELIARSPGGGGWSAPPLAAPRDDMVAVSASPASAAAREADFDRSRALVRISASARQWRAASGISASAQLWRASGDSGWLLTGDALREAQAFVGEDEDVRALVEASQVAERSAGRRQKAVLASVVAILALLCVFLYREMQTSKTAEKEAIASREAANAQSADTFELNRTLQKTLAEQAQRSREQQLELDKRQAVQAELQSVAGLVGNLRATGQINDAKIPEVIKPFIQALDQPSSIPEAPLNITNYAAVTEFARGYDPEFLQTTPGESKSARASGAITIPLPKLFGAVMADAYQDGKPIDYVNFSIVYNRARRMPIYTAVNLRRSAVVPIVLPVTGRFRYDARVPQDLQPNPGGFRGNDLDRGQLANAREIAWGPAFGADSTLAGQRAYQQVNVATNLTPQYDTFNLGLWFNTERYARELFSELSDRVTIFSGPVLSPQDPMINGVGIPRFFWKVMAAIDPDNAASLVVEAYLTAQMDETGRKIPQSTRFEPKIYRVRVSDIERLAGLDFGVLIRAADASALLPIANATLASAQGGNPASILPHVVGADEAARKAAMQPLLNMIRDERVAEGDLRTLVEGIVSLVGAASFPQLSPEARVNVLTLLAAVPKSRWNTDRWIDLEATARRAVADATSTLGGCTVTSQACALIASLKPNLDWNLATGRTVYLQFAGMVRDDVKSIADRLKKLDWTIPGEERTVAAAGTNEVRFGDSDDDRRAAELLAADLRALGRSGVRAQRVGGGKVKGLEIWISI